MSGELTDAGWSPTRSAAGKYNPWLITIILSLATFMEVLDTSVANISLAHIGGDLSATYDETSWILTSYLVANAIIVPLSGWLAQTLGRKRYYMLSVALFTLSSLACAAAPTLGLLILARIPQGLAGGGLAPCEQSMLIDTFSPSRRGRAIAAYGLVLIVGPAFGPTLGGFISDYASWRWIFLINIPVGLISLLLVARFVQEANALKAERQARRGFDFDAVGFTLIMLGLGCLQFVIDRGQIEDWFASLPIRLLTIVSALCLIALCLWERRRKDPILDFGLFRDRTFTVASILMFATGATLYATTQIVPQFLQQIMGYTASWAGLAMTASSILTIGITVLTAFLVTRVPGWLLIGIGLVMEIAGLLHATTITSEIDFWTMASDRVWLVAGLPLILVPLTTGAYSHLSAGATGQASAFLNLFRNIGGAAGISAAQTILARRTPVHAARLEDHLPYFQLRMDMFAQGFHSAFAPLYQYNPLAAPRAASEFLGQIARQSLLLAYIDVFWILAIFVACVTPLAIFLRYPLPDLGYVRAVRRRS